MGLLHSVATDPCSARGLDRIAEETPNHRAIFLSDSHLMMVGLMSDPTEQSGMVLDSHMRRLECPSDGFRGSSFCRSALGKDID